MVKKTTAEELGYTPLDDVFDWVDVIPPPKSKTTLESIFDMSKDWKNRFTSKSKKYKTR